MIISKGFYPENSPRSFRATELAKEFAIQGYEVTVLTHRRNHTQDTFAKLYKIKLIFIDEPFSNTQAICNSFPDKSLLIRAMRRFLEITLDYPAIRYKNLIRKKLEVLSGFDLIISIAVPHTIHWGVAASRKMNKNLTKKWIADCGDPYLKVETDTF